MPSHQERRDPLPADYQFPTAGAKTAGDKVSGFSFRVVRQYDIATDTYRNVPRHDGANV